MQAHKTSGEIHTAISMDGTKDLNLYILTAHTLRGFGEKDTGASCSCELKRSQSPCDYTHRGRKNPKAPTLFCECVDIFL